MMLVYLDACCLNRPMDDQTQERIHLESEAVLLILVKCQSKEWQLLGSEVLDDEVSRIPDGARRQRVRHLAAVAESKVVLDDSIETRARDLEKLGFKAYDALHVACAEAKDADVLLTTDDRMLSKAKRHRDTLRVRVENPTLWLMEVTADGTPRDGG